MRTANATTTAVSISATTHRLTIAEKYGWYGRYGKYPRGILLSLPSLLSETLESVSAPCVPLCGCFCKRQGNKADCETRADLGKRGRVVATNQNKINNSRSFARVSKARINQVSKTALKRVLYASLAQTRLRQAERPAVRSVAKSRAEAQTHFYINHGGNNYGK